MKTDLDAVRRERGEPVGDLFGDQGAVGKKGDKKALPLGVSVDIKEIGSYQGLPSGQA